MKRILSVCTFLFFVVAINAQEKSGTLITGNNKSNRLNDQVTKNEIIQIVERWREGYNSGEASKVAALYTEDAYYLTQHFITGIVHGRAAIQAYIQLGADAKYHIDSIRTISIDCSDNFAYAITRYDATNNGQKAFGVNIVVLKKIDEKWLIVAHEAAVPDPSSAIQRLDTLNFH
jgi:uncharacterized protein (TIGR02246 family)